MPVATFTKAGSKATTAAKLDKAVFGVDVPNHELLKQAYLTYLANGRANLAQTLKRGEVSGGGKKPWKQKGTGRARFGSSRNPIWRGGGIAFGPTGNETYARKMNTTAKRSALKQALSLSQDKVVVIEAIESKDGKVQPMVKLLNKIGATRNVLLVVDNKDAAMDRATRNIQRLIVTQADYVNVYDVLNADTIVISKKALDMLHDRLTQTATKSDDKKDAK